MSKNSPIPFQRLAAPARRALANAGYETMGQLAAATEVEIASLHGIGPNALATLRTALTQHGLAFAPS